MSATIVSVDDERTPLAEQALQIIENNFAPHDRQPTAQIAMQLAEKRLGLLTHTGFHLLAGLGADGKILGVSSGLYLAGVNSGFITYLAVNKAARGERLGRRLRTTLIDAFAADARKLHQPPLEATVGEVRIESRWLARLFRERAVLPLDLNYHHPGSPPSKSSTGWVLYRQPMADGRETLPAPELRQLLYAIWRIAYRVRWPLSEGGFLTMLDELEGRADIGPHPRVGR